MSLVRRVSKVCSLLINIVLGFVDHAQLRNCMEKSQQRSVLKQAENPNIMQT